MVNATQKYCPTSYWHWHCFNATVIGLHSSSLQASTLCFNNNIVRIIYDFTSCYTGINYQTNVHSNANSTSCANDSAVVSFNLYNMKQYFFIQTYTYSVRHTVHNVKEIQNWHIISAILLQGKCKIPWQEIVNGAYKCFVTIFDATFWRITHNKGCYEKRNIEKIDLPLAVT